MGYAYYYGIVKMLMMSTCLILSFFCFTGHPLHTETSSIDDSVVYQVAGTVKEVKQTTYYQWITLRQVVLKQENQRQVLTSHIQVRMGLNNLPAITENDIVLMEVIPIKQESQMNPSDMDYSAYLKGKNIIKTFKLKQILQVNKKTTIIEKGQLFLKQQLKQLYTKQNVGVMEATLLGKTEVLEGQAKILYNQSGIGHVLCISGFHVGVIIGFFTFFLCLFRIPYTIRHLVLIGGIWGYAYFTGNSTSTTRACIMVTILLLGKCLWQEEDRLNSLSLASLFFLVLSPYQLFQVGFQLSFMAVLGIIGCLNEIQKKEWFSEWRYPKWQKSLLLWLSIQLLTWPILAYHFYEIPFLISLVNLLVIPIFAVVIIGGWLSLIFYIGHLPIATVLAKGIECILNSIEVIIGEFIKWPLATLCVGRPTWWQLILFVSMGIVISAYLFEYIEKITVCKGVFIIGCCYRVFQSIIVSPLSVTLLYVGQGDSTVIETPGHHTIVIDGGNFGKGKVVEQYVKYRGKRHIEALVVSHSDADHIGGLIELLDTNLTIGKVFISETDESELLQTFLTACKRKKIPIYEMNAQDTYKIDVIQMTCLAPSEGQRELESNNNSLVCTVNYGEFTALFTGDKEKDSNFNVDNVMEPISLLKVSHHGSHTGTSESLVLKLKPMYAMISCGINNLYGHPHDEVIKLLEEAGAHISRTDLNGAICYETDGYYLKETKYRKDA